MLVAINEYQSYYFAVVKTYSATALFLTGSAYALIGAAERKSAFAAFTAGALCMLAAGARASAALALPIMALWLLEWRRNGFRGWLFFCAGAVIAGAVTLLPFALLAWDNFSSSSSNTTPCANPDRFSQCLCTRRVLWRACFRPTLQPCCWALPHAWHDSPAWLRSGSQAEPTAGLRRPCGLWWRPLRSPTLARLSL